MDNDPNDVVLTLPEPLTEYSAVDALSRVSALYTAQKKTLTIVVAQSDDASNGMSVEEARKAPPATEMTSVDADKPDTLPSEGI